MNNLNYTSISDYLNTYHLMEIFSFLNAKDLKNCSLVSHHFNNSINYLIEHNTNKKSSILDKLNYEELFKIFSLCEIEDLKSCTSVSKHFKDIIESNYQWKQLAERINIQVSLKTDVEKNDSHFVRRKIINTVLKLKDELKNLRKYHSKDIKKIVNDPKIPTIKEIRSLQKYARDTLVIWKKLAEAINQPLSHEFETSEEISKFKNWFNDHKDQLAQLQELDLSNNKLNFLSPEIGQLTSLQKLNLSNNKLTTLPSEIGQLTQLQKFNLDGNKLMTLPKEIKHWTQLKIFSLINNKLSILPRGIKKWTQLKKINLEGNKLITLPKEIENWTQLKALSLKNNKLTTLPPEIGQLTQLKILHLDANLSTSYQK